MTFIATNSASHSAANSIALLTAFFDKVEPSVATRIFLYMVCSWGLKTRSLHRSFAVVLMVVK